MEQHEAPRETFMVRDWHEGPANNLNTGHTEQPTQHVTGTISVPEPSTLGLMLAVGAVALVFGAVRALRLK